MLLDRSRHLTICGETLEPPIETRSDAPRFGEAACAACFVRASNMNEATVTRPMRTRA
jgi:hypothetical protein